MIRGIWSFREFFFGSTLKSSECWLSQSSFKDYPLEGFTDQAECGLIRDQTNTKIKLPHANGKTTEVVLRIRTSSRHSGLRVGIRLR